MVINSSDIYLYQQFFCLRHFFIKKKKAQHIELDKNFIEMWPTP